MFKHLLFHCVAITVALCSPVSLAKSDGQGEAQSRKPGPPLEVRTPEGGPLKIHEMKGKVVVVDFMTTVCPACKQASAGLQKLYQELGPKGFQPVGVALNLNSPDALKAYAQEHGLTFSLGTAQRGEAVAYLEHPSDKPLMVPTLVLLDRRGRVRDVTVGWLGEEPLRARVLELLAE